MNYGPVVVQDVKGAITDPEQVAVPKVCEGIFTEKDHKLVATTESDADGKSSLQVFSLEGIRLVVKADPLRRQTFRFTWLNTRRKNTLC